MNGCIKAENYFKTNARNVLCQNKDFFLCLCKTRRTVGTQQVTWHLWTEWTGDVSGQDPSSDPYIHAA